MRKPRSGGVHRRGQIKEIQSIHIRPPEIEDHLIPGHWEGDLIKGEGNRSSVGTLVERTTRFVVLAKMDNAGDRLGKLVDDHAGDEADILVGWQTVGDDLEQFAQCALNAFLFGQAALALLAEDLALKPGQLAAQIDDFAIFYVEQHLAQLDFLTSRLEEAERGQTERLAKPPASPSSCRSRQRWQAPTVSRSTSSHEV